MATIATPSRAIMKTPEFAPAAQNTYRNVFQNSHHFIDAARLQEVNSAAWEAIWQAIWHRQPFSVTLTAAPEPIHTDLSQLFFELKNLKKRLGNYHLCIGFPFFKHTAPSGDTLCAPLFLWEVELEALFTPAAPWRLSHQVHSRQFENPYIWQYLAEQGLDLRATVKQATQQHAIDGGYAQSMAFQIADFFGQSQGATYEGWQPLQIASPYCIQWAAVLGLFPAYTAHLLSAEEQLLPALAFSGELPIALPYHQYPANFKQHKAWAALGDMFEKVVITGVSGTGKTTTVANIVQTALLNQQRVMVVSNRTATLTQLQKLLADKGLEGLQLLLRDTDMDTLIFHEVVKSAVHQVFNYKPTFEEKAFQTAAHHLQIAQQHLQKGYDSLFIPIFGKENWRDVLALFLVANNTVGKELLLNAVSVEDFAFTKESYTQLKHIVSDSEHYFKAVNTLQHPLQALHAIHFTHADAAASLTTVLEKLNTQHKRVKAVHRQLVAAIDKYADALKENAATFFRTADKICQQLITALQWQYQMHGKRVVHTQHWWSDVRGYFSKSFKEQMLQLQHLQQQFLHLISLHQSAQYFEYAFPPAAQWQSNKALLPQVQAYQKQLQQWYTAFNSQLHSEIHRLNSKTDRKTLGLSGMLEDTEVAIVQFVRQLNLAKLFDHTVEDNTVTLVHKQQVLEKIIEQLETTKNELNDFQNFYTWHRHWLRLSYAQQQLVKTLIKVKPTDWVAAFESWFYYHLLSQKHDVMMPEAREDWQSVEQWQQELGMYLTSYTLKKWREQQKKVVEGLKKQQKSLYEHLQGKKSTEWATATIATLIGKLDLAVFTALYPALLVTPEAAAEYLPLTSPHIDCLIVEDAHLMSSAQLLPLLPLARKLILVGNTDLTSGVPDNSLHDHRFVAHTKHITLEQDFTPNLFEATKPLLTYNQQSARKLSGDDYATAIALNRVLNGVFDEHQLTNAAEAERIVELLLTMQWHNRVYPTVAVACATRQQRNYIYKLLQDIKQRRAVHGEVLQQLERNGLGIYTFAEMTDVHAEVLIIGLTYGLNEHQQLTGEITYLQQPEGTWAVTRLLATACQRLVVCHSLPSHYITTYAQQAQPNGMYILANFIMGNRMAYDKTPADTPLLTDTKPLPTTTAATLVSPLYDAMAAALLYYFAEHRIQQHWILDDYVLPLVITADVATSRKYVILADAIYHEDTPVALSWELGFRRKLQQQQFIVIDTFSVQWWRNATQEAKRVAELIMVADDEWAAAHPIV